MLQLISFSKKKDLSFQPGVFTKCAAAIESCKLLEQLQAANKMVENNYNNLTEAQYMTLKNRIARHPCAAHLVIVPVHNDYTLFIPKPMLAILIMAGISSWSMLAWWYVL